MTANTLLANTLLGGLKIVEMEGIIDEGLKAVFANQPVPASLKRRFNGCGAGVTCKGTGNGCG